MGVDIFFVLSGYLISSILLNEYEKRGDICISKFYVKRIFRLVPALMTMLFAYVILAPFFWPDQSFLSHIGQAGLAAFYLSDYSHAIWGIPRAIAHTWSLSVEEHFYLIWPWVLLWLLKRRPTSELPLILLGMYLVGFFWRWLSSDNGAYWDITYYRFDARTTGLLLGALLAATLKYKHPSSRSRQCYIGIALIAPVIWVTLRLFQYGYNELIIQGLLTYKFSWEDPWMLIWGVAFAEGIAATVILATLNQKIVYAVLSTPLLVWIGRMSYSLYLWHYPIFYYLRPGRNWESTLLIGMPLTLICSIFSFYFVEKWGRNLRNRVLQSWDNNKAANFKAEKCNLE